MSDLPMPGAESGRSNDALDAGDRVNHPRPSDRPRRSEYHAGRPKHYADSAVYYDTRSRSQR
jgi:hypothetical protein